jgi:hypothetical protein
LTEQGRRSIDFKELDVFSGMSALSDFPCSSRRNLIADAAPSGARQAGQFHGL